MTVRTKSGPRLASEMSRLALHFSLVAKSFGICVSKTDRLTVTYDLASEDTWFWLYVIYD